MRIAITADVSTITTAARSEGGVAGVVVDVGKEFVQNVELLASQRAASAAKI